MNRSSSPADAEGLVRIPLKRLHPHPANPNLMSRERLETLKRNIERSRRYPPLVVRPYPERPGEFQFLDGEQRGRALGELGHTDALCYVWDCDDETALLLLATLNRLEGEDVPARRAELVEALSALLPPQELALLLPEDATQIEQLLRFGHLDPDALLADLTAAAEHARDDGPRLISFALDPADEAVVERAVTHRAAALDGRNKRGRALASICRDYLERPDA